MAETKHRQYLEGFTFVDSVDKLPALTHFAVLESSTIQSSDGYDGYYTNKIVKYIAMADKEALDDYILNQGKNKTFKVIQVKPVEITLHTTVSVKE